MQAETKTDIPVIAMKRGSRITQLLALRYFLSDQLKIFRESRKNRNVASGAQNKTQEGSSVLESKTRAGTVTTSNIGKQKLNMTRIASASGLP